MSMTATFGGLSGYLQCDAIPLSVLLLRRVSTVKQNNN